MSKSKQTPIAEPHDAILQVRLTTADLERIQAAAAHDSRSVSEFVRVSMRIASRRELGRK